MTRILVVDDEREIAELVEAVLLSEGYEVRTAFNGQDALDTVASSNGHLPHLVLLDVMMPDVDGCEVLKQLKSDSNTSSIPVVLMSAACRLDSLVVELRAEGKLPKPFSVHELLGCVARHALEDCQPANMLAE